VDRRTDEHRKPNRPPEPPLPSGADAAALDAEVRRELSSLVPDNARRVGDHLAAAGLLLDDDPKAAYAHASFAKALAGRIGVVREAVGISAYSAGDYGTALAELRAARRITGDASQLPLMADCERALGRPQNALALLQDPQVRKLPKAVQVELSIVCSGARRDMGQAAAAVVALQGPDLDADSVSPWSPRLWYAYADALLECGRNDEARQWFSAAAAIDDDEQTDAMERLAELG
jgi:tetratricopeptide (TPR) repeat protein